MNKVKSVGLIAELRTPGYFKIGLLGLTMLVQFAPGVSVAASSSGARSVLSLGFDLGSESGFDSGLAGMPAHETYGAGIRLELETPNCYELLSGIYNQLSIEYSKEIRRNFTKQDLDAIRIAESNLDPIASSLIKQASIKYFKEVILSLHVDVKRLMNQMLIQSDRVSAYKLVESAIADQLAMDRIVFENELVNPKLKLNRFRAWEKEEKVFRLDNQRTDVLGLYATLDTAFQVIESRDFIPALVRKFGVYLQFIKNIHDSRDFGDPLKQDQLWHMREEIIQMLPRLKAYSAIKKYATRALRTEAFNEEFNKMNLNRSARDTTIVDLSIIQLMREAVTKTLRFPSQSVKLQVSDYFNGNPKELKIEKSNHELDYIRRRMSVNYMGSCPKDYRADFFQFFSHEKSFLTEEVLGGFVNVAGAEFKMGSPDSEPGRFDDEVQHQVTLDTFGILSTAVSQSTYASIMGHNPSHFKKKKYCKESFQTLVVKGKKVKVCADYPVEQVSWEDASRFVAQVNKEFEDSVYRYRLPTEAEVEYAVIRGGGGSAYISGTNSNNLEQFILFNEEPENKKLSRKKTTYSVSKKGIQSNGFGIYRSGVWEWTQDFYAPFTRAAQINPQGPASGTGHPLRGGSFFTGDADCRSARRIFKKADDKSRNSGFRLVRVLKNG